MMFDSVEELEVAIRDHLEDLRFYSRQSWVVPAVTAGGEKVFDAVIVGAGQNGLALAYNLKLRGVRRLVVVDAQDTDQPGPWLSFARMQTLRTPKWITGPECSNPMLSFKVWFCSRYSKAEYDTFGFIPLPYFREYLKWYRHVLEIETLNNRRVTDIQWDPLNDCLKLTVDGPQRGGPTTLHARKVCLATGMAGAGRWAPPADLAAGLPRSSYYCCWESIPWHDLTSRDVAVIGAGASGFDNAACALEAGCRSVTIYGSRPFPERDIYFELWRGRDDSGVHACETGHTPADLLDPLLAHNASLPDADRIRLVSSLMQNGWSPANPEYLARVPRVDEMVVRADCPVQRLVYLQGQDQVRVETAADSLDFDQVIFATGAQPGLEHRPELRRLWPRIRTWRDEAGEEVPLPSDLDKLPKLSPRYQLQSKEGVPGPEFEHIYSLADLVHIVVGLQSIRFVVSAVAEHLSASLYTSQVCQIIAMIDQMVASSGDRPSSESSIPAGVSMVGNPEAGRREQAPGILFSWNRTDIGLIEKPLRHDGIVFDETLRDGVQSPDVANPKLAEKFTLIDHMVSSGITAADFGFPGSSDLAGRECLEIARYVATSGHPLSIGFAGRTHAADIRAICEIGQAVGVLIDAYVFIGVSPIRQYVEDWSLESIAGNIRAAAAECQRGGVRFVLVLEDATRCTPERLSALFSVGIDVGVERVTLCDTVGASVPAGTEALLRWSRQYFADRQHNVSLEWHGHNDRGLAVSNSLKALALGCVRVHGTVLGIGERAGNASIDQIMLNRHLEAECPYDLGALRRYCESASVMLGVAIPGNYPAMGSDVFKTSAGVHASAILKAHRKGDIFLKDSVYSAVPAGLLGREQEILIDQSSGANNVRYWIDVQGVEADDSVIHQVLSAAKSSNRALCDDEIRQIIASAK
jgi:2-isopropylmalate synthase